MSALSDEVYALACKLTEGVDSDDSPQIDIRVDYRQGARPPNWHGIVWDGQIGKDDDTGESLYGGLNPLAVASGVDMADVLTRLHDILTERQDNQEDE